MCSSDLSSGPLMDDLQVLGGRGRARSHPLSEPWPWLPWEPLRNMHPSPALATPLVSLTNDSAPDWLRKEGIGKLRRGGREGKAGEERGGEEKRGEEGRGEERRGG